MAKKLSSKQVEAFCKTNAGWSTNTKSTVLQKTYTRDSYLAGLMFIARTAVLAEAMNHHPDIEYTYSKVKVKLSTHDKDGVTELDTALAEKLDALADR